MKYTTEHIEYLWRQYISGKASEAEWDEFLLLNQSVDYDEEQTVIIEKILAEYPQHTIADIDARERILQGIIKEYAPKEARVVKAQFLRRSGWAAAVILLLGAGFYIWQSSQKTNPALSDNKNPLQTKILPGDNKAVLSVGDTVINLDNDKTGIISSGNMITYNDGEHIADAAQMVTLSTPRGGQYQAVLPDGTKVWLNAASSIRFPSKFNGEERLVDVKGEVYLEIAPHARAPFKVNTGKTVMEVLGTSFNVHAYADEDNQQTTVITGSVKVTLQNNTTNGKEYAVILRPGEAAIAKESLQVNRGVDTEQVLAWKNGVFNFDGLPLSEVAKQLERWYDIAINYDPRIASLVFRGKIYRNTNLVNFLDILDGMGFAYQLEGRVLHVEKK